MALDNIKISDLPAAESIEANGDDYIEVSAAQPVESEVPYLSRKLSLSRLGNWIGSTLNFNTLQTTAKTVVGAINELNSSSGGSFWDSVPDGPGAHNSFFRGANLGDPANIDWNTIAQDKFHNMFIGDYWRVYDQTTQQWITWRIAAFDYYRGVGTKGNAAPHITIIPDETIVPGPTQIFTSPGFGAVGGYMASSAKGFKVTTETHLSSEGYLDNSGSTDPRYQVYVIDLEHSLQTSEYYFVVDGVLTVPNSINGWHLSGGKIQYQHAQNPPVTPSFSEITVVYRYCNDSDVQICEETFTNADVKNTYGDQDMFNNGGYVTLSHQLLTRERSSILEVLVDGQPTTHFYYGLNGFQVGSSSNSTASDAFVNAQTIKITYKYGNEYGALNQAKRIVERAFGLNNHIMQTYDVIASRGSVNTTNNTISINFNYDYNFSDIEIPTEQHITGSRTIGVEDNWTSFSYNQVGNVNTEKNGSSSQLPLFALRPDLRCNGTGYWLRDRCYATPLSQPVIQAELDAFNTLFLGVNATGEVTAESGSGGQSSFGIRPIFNLACQQNPLVPPVISN